ncbi:alpha/beta hydrolase [Rhizobium wenxiniae]|nr:alpha/beta hydrolase-fold protein [Rhizobium wenxiniae]MBW9091213.1 alpha/beta hydrolase [Rhizobium wenxiniae]
MSEWQSVQLPAAKTFEICSKRTGESYRILVRIPAGPPPQTGYPVLWMLDGDASFPLVFTQPANGLFPPASKPSDHAAGLIVAIGFPGGAPFDAPARSRNYTPEPDHETGDVVSSVFGGAKHFLHFLVEELRPVLSELYPLDPARNTLFGFSYGGLFTVHTLLHCPGHFQRYWAASPSLWFSDALMMRRMRENAATGKAERLVITVGKDEQYATHALPAGRQEHLSRRAMVDNITEAASLIARANPATKVDLVVAADHDHFDMLLHGVRRAQAMAFSQP